MSYKWIRALVFLITLSLVACGETSEEKSANQSAEKMIALDNEAKELLKKFAAFGMPDETWGVQKLNDYIEVLQQMKLNSDQKMAILDQHSSSMSNQDTQKVRKNLNGVKTNADNLIKAARELLAKKRAA